MHKFQARHSLRKPLLHLEDVFITGVLAEKCKVERIHEEKFRPFEDRSCGVAAAVMDVPRNMLSYPLVVDECRQQEVNRRRSSEVRHRVRRDVERAQKFKSFAKRKRVTDKIERKLQAMRK